jgi:hypothetical protein
MRACDQLSLKTPWNWEQDDQTFDRAWLHEAECGAH